MGTLQQEKRKGHNDVFSVCPTRDSRALTYGKGAAYRVKRSLLMSQILSTSQPAPGAQRIRPRTALVTYSRGISLPTAAAGPSD